MNNLPRSVDDKINAAKEALAAVLTTPVTAPCTIQEATMIGSRVHLALDVLNERTEAEAINVRIHQREQV